MVLGDCWSGREDLNLRPLGPEPEVHDPWDHTWVQGSCFQLLSFAVTPSETRTHQGSGTKEGQLNGALGRLYPEGQVSRPATQDEEEAGVTLALCFSECPPIHFPATSLWKRTFLRRGSKVGSIFSQPGERKYGIFSSGSSWSSAFSGSPTSM